MHTRSKKRTLFVLLIFLTVLIGLPVWSVCRQVHQEQLNRDLIAAIKKNDTATAISLLNAGADANTTDRGSTPVSARQVLRAWWDQMHGMKPVASVFHPSALIVASEIYGYSYTAKKVMPPENVAVFQALLDHGADPNTGNEEETTPLMAALICHHTATARLLLDHGAGVQARGHDAATALMWAYDSKPTGMIELLLARIIHEESKTSTLCRILR